MLNWLLQRNLWTSQFSSKQLWTTINRFLCFLFQTCFAIHSTRKLRELLMSSQRLSFNDSMKLACSIEATSLEQLEEHIFPKVIEPCKINVIQQALFLSHRTSNIREVICKVTSVDCIFWMSKYSFCSCSEKHVGEIRQNLVSANNMSESQFERWLCLQNPAYIWTWISSRMSR